MQTRSLLLLGDTESLTGSAGGFGSLTLDLQVPEVTQTSMVADLLHALKILSESSIDDVGVDLGPASVLDAALSVEEPLGDAVLGGLGEDVTDLVDLIDLEVAGASVDVDLSDLADEGGESSADTLDDAQSEWNFVLAVHVRVHHTQKVLELAGTRKY